MAFNTIETSVESRRPVELYTFAREFQTFRYTSADRDITFGPDLYSARTLSRSAVEQSSEMQRRAIKITTARDFEIADMFRITPPSSAVTCSISQFHYGDTEARVVWTGRVATVEWNGSTAVMTMEPVFTALRRVGLRRAYQKQCPHVLYGTACGVAAAAFKASGPAAAISGLDLTITAAASQANGYWVGGFVEYAVELGLAERRFITGHSSTVLTLNAPPTGLSIGTTVNVYPGCDHTLTTCQSKFSNVVNFGGMPYFTKKNPFSGDPIY